MIFRQNSQLYALILCVSVSVTVRKYIRFDIRHNFDSHRCELLTDEAMKHVRSTQHWTVTSPSYRMQIVCLRWSWALNNDARVTISFHFLHFFLSSIYITFVRIEVNYTKYSILNKLCDSVTQHTHANTLQFRVLIVMSSRTCVTYRLNWTVTIHNCKYSSQLLCVYIQLLSFLSQATW